MAEGILAEIIRRKRQDVGTRLRGSAFDPPPTRRSLRAALARPGARFIMEVKQRSPSGHRSAAGVDAAVRAYAPVADAISVLTDGPFFGGSLADLGAARTRFDGPLLAKDFVIEPRQVVEARAHGADAVLAILAALDDAEAAGIMAEARRLGMDVVVEVHDEAEVRRAIALGAAIIGINNRDLKTLRTDFGVTERLARLVPPDVVCVSESGIRSRGDVLRLAAQADAFLVGSSLMAAEDIDVAARSLVHGVVKICGLTRTEDVAAAADYGATHAGFIFAGDSPRRVDGDAEITAEARRRGLIPVGVFRSECIGVIADTAHRHCLGAVQVHGRPADLGRLRAALPDGCEIWAACGVGDDTEDPLEGADRTLFDTAQAGRTGGAGVAFDWRRIAGREDVPKAFLAGGIGPHNARAAQDVGTFGIDVSSAVERAPGQKDAGKIGALFDALRPPARGMPS